MHVFLADGSSWRWNGAHQKRPLSSVVLEPGVKDMLIADAKDFLASEAWYADRGAPWFSVSLTKIRGLKLVAGIPYRRGYLLYGVRVLLPYAQVLAAYASGFMIRFLEAARPA